MISRMGYFAILALCSFSCWADTLAPSLQPSTPPATINPTPSSEEPIASGQAASTSPTPHALQEWSDHVESFKDHTRWTVIMKASRIDGMNMDVIMGYSGTTNPAQTAIVVINSASNVVATWSDTAGAPAVFLGKEKVEKTPTQEKFFEATLGVPITAKQLWSWILMDVPQNSIEWNKQGLTPERAVMSDYVISYPSKMVSYTDEEAPPTTQSANPSTPTPAGNLPTVIEITPRAYSQPITTITMAGMRALKVGEDDPLWPQLELWRPDAKLPPDKGSLDKKPAAVSVESKNQQESQQQEKN